MLQWSSSYKISLIEVHPSYKAIFFMAEGGGLIKMGTTVPLYSGSEKSLQTINHVGKKMTM